MENLRYESKQTHGNKLKKTHGNKWKLRSKGVNYTNLGPVLAAELKPVYLCAFFGI